MPAKSEKHRAKFNTFHRNNPVIMEMLIKYARAIQQKGRDTYSCSTILGVIRWRHDYKSNDPNSVFKINKNYESFYARLAMKKAPDLTGFFRTREAGDDFEH